MTARRDRFTGRIAGVGTTSGVRVVVGRWDQSPWGGFTDVMLAQPDGLRVLLAPSQAMLSSRSGSVAIITSAFGANAVIDCGPLTAIPIGTRLGGKSQSFAESIR